MSAPDEELEQPELEQPEQPEQPTITRDADTLSEQLPADVAPAPMYAVYDNDLLRFLTDADADEDAVLKQLLDLRAETGHDLIALEV